jgi:hypothetical protein
MAGLLLSGTIGGPPNTHLICCFENGVIHSNATHGGNDLGFLRRSHHNPGGHLGFHLRSLRAKRSIAIDRVEFEECRQAVGESFDEFYMRLHQIATGVNLCP